jgi:hypothetical protein
MQGAAITGTIARLGEYSEHARGPSRHSEASIADFPFMQVSVGSPAEPMKKAGHRIATRLLVSIMVRRIRRR